MTQKPLPRSFYERPTEQVARELLGKLLVHRCPDGEVSGMVVEAEAYLGNSDPGSHASTRRTRRNAVMFGPAGVAYVYFTYGMHHCFNAVAKPPGEAGAVLIRSLQPVGGIPLMMKRRGRQEVRELASGPAKLTRAFGIDGRHNGLDLTKGSLFFSPGPALPFQVSVTNRIGLSKGKHLPLRFCVTDNTFVSSP